ncbi:T-cell immunoglobulin and mucin domain-containing protein 4 [Lepisosteus oculatus]|uniref:T-cell immunoglobulin and mucin domain-containing protein 4 n=1 Tax=Lepisosteus oculatus TaxID=7918 RepID=UPI0035F50DF8
MPLRAGLWLHWILTVAIAAPRSSAAGYRALEGGAVSLACRYSVKRYGLSRVCWGRNCGTLWCSDTIVQTDGSRVISKVSDRYRLNGDIPAGQVDLTISRVRQADSGSYCCRVDIDGYFNDQKVSHTLQVLKAPAEPSPSASPVTPTPGHSGHNQSEPQAAGGRVEAESPRLTEDDAARNPSLPRSGGVEESAIVTQSLQINVPVLAGSITVLLFLLLASSLALLGFRRQIQKRSQNETGRRSATPAEPRHIIHEIETRRPVEENIYTLD